MLCNVSHFPLFGRQMTPGCWWWGGREEFRGIWRRKQASLFARSWTLYSRMMFMDFHAFRLDIGECIFFRFHHHHGFWVEYHSESHLMDSAHGYHVLVLIDKVEWHVDSVPQLDCKWWTIPFSNHQDWWLMDLYRLVDGDVNAAADCNDHSLEGFSVPHSGSLQRRKRLSKGGPDPMILAVMLAIINWSWGVRFS